MSKIIAIVGATGNQGSSVARTFLQKNWHVRCLTRTPASPASQSLASLGAEIIQADLSNPTSLTTAFSNVNVIFLNTTFWELYTTQKETALETEISYGKNAVDAAASIPSLERFIYSSLPGVSKASKGKYSVNHADSKAAITEYIMTTLPDASFIYLGAYNTNPMLAPTFMGKFNFVLPFGKHLRIPIIDPNSTGPFVHALLNEDPGTNLLAYDSYLSFGEVADLWSKASGQDVGYMQVTVEMILAQGVAKEVVEGVGALEEFGYMGKMEYIEPNQLKKKVETKSFEDWLRERDWEKVLDDIKSGKTGIRKA